MSQTSATSLTPPASLGPIASPRSDPGSPSAARASHDALRFRALAGGRTPLDGQSASRYLAAAYRQVTGTEASGRTLGLLWAQWALETARGQAMYGNNFGGIKAGARAPGATFATTEGHGANQRRVFDRFRTYGSPEEGARDYVSLLSRRYPDAFAAVAAGDAAGFAHGLSREGYFTARAETYRRGLERLAGEHAAGSEQLASPPSHITQLLQDALSRALAEASERSE